MPGWPNGPAAKAGERIAADSPETAAFADLLRLRERVAALATVPADSRSARLATRAGAHRSAAPGRGLEFAELRAYQPGDEPRQIDWRHTARRGRPYTKVFQAERERPLWLLVDLGASMRFATRGVFKSVQAARVGAVLAWAAVAAGDRVGGGVAGTGEFRLLPPIGREQGALRLLRQSAGRSALPPAGGPGGLAAGLAELLGRVRAADEIAVISDFISLDEAAWRLLASLAVPARLSLLQIADSLEIEPPPPGVYRLAAGAKEQVIDFRQARVREAWRAAFAERADRLAGFVLARGGRYELVTTADDPVAVLARQDAPRRRAVAD